MLYDLRVRVESPFLGDNRYPNIRRFRRAPGSEEWWLLRIPQWHWACKEAATALGMVDVDTSQVHFTEKFRRATAILYRHNFTRNGQQAHEMFEAVNKNSILTFEVFLPETPERGGKTRPPTRDELRKIFEFIGQYVGLSPWGSQFGFGRFTVEDVRLANDALLQQLMAARGSRLPAEFMEQHRAAADHIVFLGFPLTALSRQELLAVTAFLKTQLESSIRSNGDNPDDSASPARIEGGADIRDEAAGAG